MNPRTPQSTSTNYLSSSEQKNAWRREILLSKPKWPKNTQRSEKAITRNKKIDFSHMGERQSYYYSYQTCHYCKNLHRDVRYTCENDIRKKRKCKASFCSECIDSFFPEYYISEREDSDYGEV